MTTMGGAGMGSRARASGNGVVNSKENDDVNATIAGVDNGDVVNTSSTSASSGEMGIGGGCMCCGGPSDARNNKRRRVVAPPSIPVPSATAMYPVRPISFTETDCQYQSVQELLSEIRRNRHEGFEQLLKQHILIGVVDYTFCSVQYGQRLLLLDYSLLLQHLFYQLAIRRFGVMPHMLLSTPICIRDFLLAALMSPDGRQWVPEIAAVDTIVTSTNDSSSSSSSGSSSSSSSSSSASSDSVGGKGATVEEVADTAVAILVENAELLQEYFRIGVNADGYLCTLPELLPNHNPTPELLPLFLLRLVMRTNWDEELSCFKNIATELAIYYAALPVENDTMASPPLSTANDASDGGEGTLPVPSIRDRDFPGPKGSELFRTVLLPALKAHLYAPRQCANDSTTVVHLASLDQLYKVFERC